MRIFLPATGLEKVHTFRPPSFVKRDGLCVQCSLMGSHTDHTNSARAYRQPLELDIR